MRPEQERDPRDQRGQGRAGAPSGPGQTRQTPLVGRGGDAGAAGANLGLPVLPDPDESTLNVGGPQSPQGRMPFDAPPNRPANPAGGAANAPAAPAPLGARNMPMPSAEAPSAGAAMGPAMGPARGGAMPRANGPRSNGAPAAAPARMSGPGGMPMSIPGMPISLPPASLPPGARMAAPQRGAQTPLAHRQSMMETGQQRSLGVTDLLEPALLNPPANTANEPTLADPHTGVARTPTLTSQLRSIRPPDVARQALSELGVLARELASLPDEIAASGLARIQQISYLEAVAAYQELAYDAWGAIAEERLEQSGAEPEYRQRAISIAREATRLRRESKTAADNTQLPLPRRVPFLWRTRMRLIQTGLRDWQGEITTPPDARATGYALFLLRGRLSLAGGGAFELATLTLFIRLALILTPVVGLAALLPCVAAIVTGDALQAASLAVTAILVFLLWMLLLLLTSRSRTPLGVLLGASVFSPQRTPCNGRPGSAVVGVLLRAWWILVGVVVSVGLVGAIAASGYSLFALLGAHGGAGAHALAPHTLAQGLTLAGGLLALVVGPLALVAGAGLLALAIPTLLLSVWRFAVELGANASWTPVARRYALTPALTMLGFLLGAALGVVWYVSTLNGLQFSPLLTVVANGRGLLNAIVVTVRVIPLALTLALPYLALIETPYRIGVGRWRRVWLRELGMRRANLESHVRRLSAPDPRTGAQNTSDENLRAMQYDLVLLQFYREKIAEAERTPSAPFGFGGALFLLALVVVGALLFDSGALALGGMALVTP